MRRLIAIGMLVGAAALSMSARGGPRDAVNLTIPSGHFATLCFHDVRDDVVPGVDRDPDAISTQRLARFFDWMQTHDWHPVSLADIEAAHAGRKRLPDNAVLLSFDDGLESTYTKVFPLLEAFGYPAMVALETGWLRHVHGQSVDSPHMQTPNIVDYNGAELGKHDFVGWPQVREMQRSGLVTIASHTDNLHHGIHANPQHNVEPSAMTRRYFAKTGRYETDPAFAKRIRRDLAKSVRVIERHTGRKPQAIVWPYGAQTPQLTAIAANVGLSPSFGLGDRHWSSVAHIKSLGRFLILDDPKPAAIQAQVRQALAPPKHTVRAVQVDLDDIYDADPKQVNRNLSALLDRVKAMRISTVYLQAYADPDGDGVASALYFPNHVLPMRADLFNRVAWQLRTRTGVEVYAWLPLLAFRLPDAKAMRQLSVKRERADGLASIRANRRTRLSPFRARSLAIVKGIYADLAKNYPTLHGILIGDDATLSADEGALYCHGGQWPGAHRAPRCPLSPRAKTNALIAFGDAVVGHMRQFLNTSNAMQTSRNLFARVVLDPSAERRFAQALGPFLRHYDSVALMAMPYLDGTREAPDRWLRRLAKRVAAKPGGLRKTVFELQTRNWQTDQWIPEPTLTGWMRELIGLGAVNIAYYPDDFLANRPRFAPTFSAFSLNDFPHREAKP